MLLCGLRCFINSKKPPSEPVVKLVDPTHATFKELHNVLERCYKELNEQGVGAVRKQAEVISVEEEQLLWDSGMLGTHSPLALLNAVFYYNGLNFILCGGQEHRELKISQLIFKEVTNPDSPAESIEIVEYHEFGSKKPPGGRHQLNLHNKVVTHYARPDLGERCHIQLLKLYLSKLPKVALDRDIFYWKELPVIPRSPGDPWYKAVPIGHNMLARKPKTILQSAGVDAEN